MKGKILGRGRDIHSAPSIRLLYLGPEPGTVPYYSGVIVRHRIALVHSLEKGEG